MRIEFTPSKASGEITAPPSKSMAHRLLICAGLASGESIVKGVSPSEDVLATIDCLNALGAVTKYENDTVYIKGIDTKNISAKNILNCRECGSTIRFFIPICLLSKKEITLAGSEKLLSRPLDIYKTLCDEHGLYFENTKDFVKTKGVIKSGEYVLPGNISSQFITGLLFALPTLDSDSRISITQGVDSRSYINLTIDALKTFGVSTVWEDEKTLFIKGNQKYKAQEVIVEGDYSNCAFFEALNYLGSDIKINGLKEDSIQGDKVYLDYFKKIKEGYTSLSLSDCPDLGPIAFAVAAFFDGAEFTGTRRLKIKESDRGLAMAKELKKFGVDVTLEDDKITVLKSTLHTPNDVLCGHNDHRIVMALSVLLTVTGGIIDEAEAVKKSLPDFFDILLNLGINLKKI